MAPSLELSKLRSEENYSAFDKDISKTTGPIASKFGHDNPETMLDPMNYSDHSKTRFFTFKMEYNSGAFYYQLDSNNTKARLTHTREKSNMADTISKVKEHFGNLHVYN